MRRTISIAVGIGVMFTLTGFLAPAFPPLEMGNHFRPLILLGFLMVLPAAIAFRARTAGLCTAAALILNAALLALPMRTAATAANANIAPASRLKLVSLNVWVHNQRLADVAAFLRSQNADIVTLQEVPRKSAEQLLPMLKDIYPHQVVCNPCRNQALLAKKPWLDLSQIPVTDDGPGALTTRFSDGRGGAFRVFAMHPAYPFRPFEQARNYDWLTRNLKITSEPLIVVGDFNVTPWSWNMARLQRATGLHRHGTWRRSWPGHLPIQTFLIDNMLTSATIKAVSFETGPSVGSDHLPIIATLQLL